MSKRRSLREAFGEREGHEQGKHSPSETASDPDTITSEPVNPAQQHSSSNAEPVTREGEVEMVPGKDGEMIPADKPVNMTFTVTAKERYLWTLELKRQGRSAVSVLRDTMNGYLKDS